MAGGTGVGPITGSDRIDVMDALRGFALLGVFIANLHSFSAWFMMSEAEQIALAGPFWRSAEGLLFAWFIDGKFYTIFSLLFGIGFALQLDRLQKRGDHAARRFARRMAGLLMIGLFHLIVIWYGDILTLYALSGFILLALRRWSDRHLLTAAVILILVPVPGAALVHLAGASADFGLYAVSDRVAIATGHSVTAIPAWVLSPDWGSFIDWQASSFFYRIGALLATWRLAKVVAIMMIGLWAGRRLIDGTLCTDRARLRWVLLWGSLIGVPANFLMAAMGGIEGPYSWRLVLGETGYALGVVPLALAYAAAFVLAWPRSSAVLGMFAPVGRMALTNYLSQSILGVLIFHGIGLGFGAKLSPGGFLLLGLVLFAGQILVSRAWLSRFGQGPMEKLWRWMTYGVIPPSAGHASTNR